MCAVEMNNITMSCFVTLNKKYINTNNTIAEKSSFYSKCIFFRFYQPR